MSQTGRTPAPPQDPMRYEPLSESCGLGLDAGDLETRLLAQTLADLETRLHARGVSHLSIKLTRDGCVLSAQMVDGQRFEIYSGGLVQALTFVLE